jgi:hypothetical protein
MKKSYLISALAFVAVFGILAVALYIPQKSELTHNMKVGYNVCVTKNLGRADQEPTSCVHNIVYNNGLQGIIEEITTGANWGAFKNISLGNGSAPVADNSETFNLFSSCNMSSIQGSVGNLGTGNRSIWYTFTSNCSNVYVNATRITNVSGGLFAGLSFTGTTLQSGDTLTINATEWASN